MKIKTKISKVALAVALGLFTIQMPVAEAGLQDKLNSIFNDMSNVNSPGYFETARRGVISGGSAYVRSPIVRTRLVDFQPPSISAGCGGISFYGGSFSFINADQFIALLRAVAANAKGYAFQLALDVACPSCKQLIGELQGKIQELNSKLKNSCELAKWMMDESGVSSAIKTTTSQLSSTVEGYFSDMFASTEKKDEKTANVVSAQKNDDNNKKIVGNLLYKQLTNNNAKNWMKGSVGTEQDEYELIQSATGTIVVTPPPAAKDGKGSDQYGFLWYPPKLSLTDLIEGGTDKPIIGCKSKDDECAEINEDKTISFNGLVTIIREHLVGKDGNIGLIKKFHMEKNNAPSDAEKLLFNGFPPSALALLRNMAINSEDFAIAKAQSLAEAIALDMADYQIQASLTAAKQAITNSDSSDKKEMVKMIEEAQQKVYQDYMKYAQNHMTLSKLTTEFNASMSTMRNVVLYVNGTKSIVSSNRTTVNNPDVNG